MKKPYQPVKINLYEAPNIFPEDLSFDERIKLTEELGNKAKEEFDEKYPKIKNWFEEYDQLYILSYCAMYFVSHPVGVDPEASGGLDFYHHDLEILQAFALMSSRNLTPSPLLDKSEELIDDFKEISQLLAMKQFQELSKFESEEEIYTNKIQMEIRSHTTSVRNWAYGYQIDRITRELATKLNDKFKNMYGISSDRFINILYSLVKLGEEKLNQHRAKLRSFRKKNDYRKTIDAYLIAFPDVNPISDDEAKDLWKQSGKSLKNLRFMLTVHTDLNISEIYTFSISDMINIYGDSSKESEIRSLFDKLSHEFGDLKDHNEEHFILGNPCLQKPFIKIDNNHYYSSIIGIFPHLSLSILEELISVDDKFSKEYSDTIKPKYLEEKTELLVRQQFQNGAVFRGIEWNDPQTKENYENDIIVLVDDFALVIECKSGSIPPPAKRGAPKRLERTIKDILEKTSIQTHRLIDYLSKEDKIYHFVDINGNEVEIDSSTINYYIPLGVTFDNFGPIFTQQKVLIKSGLLTIPENQITPSISFTDLEIVFDVLTFESQKLHYLNRRREFECNVNYLADEIDLLAFYLDNGFNIGDSEFKNISFVIYGKSKEVDPHFTAKSEGAIVPIIKQQMSDYWESILTRVSSRRPKGWMQLSYILLNTTRDEQINFESSFNELKDSIQNDSDKQPNNRVELHTAPEQRTFIIIGYAYKNIDREERNSVMQQILWEQGGKDLRGIAIIGDNVGNADRPYTVIAASEQSDLFL